MERIVMLDITFKFPGAKDAIHPVLLKSGNALALTDCGYPGFLPDMERAIKGAGFSADALTHIILTHHDFDHMGAAGAFKQKYPGIKIVAGKEEAPYISGQKESPRLLQAREMQKTLPAEKQAFGRKFCEIVSSVQSVAVDIEVSGGERPAFCSGIQIVATPGHTPGHISVFAEEESTLVTGDAAVLENGRLAVANPAFTLDISEAERSLLKIKNYGAEKIICYHGGVFYPPKK
jgi:glyoxylase-like metal-dependent hydrolase (beta-lactamase superfamily II)